MRPSSLLIASLLALGCSNTGNPTASKNVTEPATTSAPTTATARAAVKPTATATPTNSASAGAKPFALPSDGKCAATGLTAARVVSQASHAGARTDVRLELDSRKLHGTGYRLENDTPIPKKIERTVDAKEVRPLLALLEKLCTAVETASKRQDSAPGGYTRFELIYGDNVVVAAYGAPVKTGELFIPLTHEQFKALGDTWPRSKE